MDHTGQSVAVCHTQRAFHAIAANSPRLQGGGRGHRRCHALTARGGWDFDTCHIVCRDHFVHAPSHWATMLHCNVVSLAGCIHKMIPMCVMTWRASLGNGLGVVLEKSFHAELAFFILFKFVVYHRCTQENVAAFDVVYRGMMSCGGHCWNYYSGILSSLLTHWPLVDFNKILENNFQANFSDGCDISSEIALRWTSLDLSDDKSTLVQVMAWCRQATSHYLNQCWPRSLTPYGVTRPPWVNSMWPSDTIWRHRPGSTQAQVRACCLTAPGHYLNQCWLFINEVLWHWSERDFT